MEEKPKPKTKKKAEEPIRQSWNRKDRLLVLSVLLFTTTIPLSFFYSQSRPQFAFSLPKINFHRSPQIENDYVFPKQTEDEFTRNFKVRTANLKGVYGYYLYNFSTQNKSGLFIDEHFPLNPFINELILASSSSVALQSRREYEQTLKSLGMLSTFLDKNTTTPENISKLYYYLYQNKLLKNNIFFKEGNNAFSFVKIIDPTILVIMSKGSTSKEANILFQEYQ